MDQFAARIDGVLHHLEDQGVGGRQMLKIARASTYAQIVLAMMGSLAFVYGTVHASALALSLYAVVAMEIKAPRLLKIYAVLLAALTITDFFWLATYAGPIGSGTTGMTVTVGPNSANIDSSLMSIKWGLLASSVNNFFCLVPELFAFFVRVASVALWVLMWSKGLLDGNDGDMYNDPNLSHGDGSSMKHEPIPGSPARTARAGGDLFTADGGYQDSEGLLSRAV